MDKVLISVIIPVYNVEKYLQECLDSVVSQSLRDIEIICINDASTDLSNEILNKYASMDSRIKIINQGQNKGLAFVRNVGLETAIGDYFIIVDSDDILKKDALHTMYSYMEKHNLDGLLFEGDCITDDGFEKYLGIVKRTGVSSKVKDGVKMFSNLINNGAYYPYVWCQCWRRKYLIDNSIKFINKHNPHEDIFFSFVAITKAEKILCIQKSFYIYRRRANSITTTKINPMKMRAYLTLYVDLMMYIEEYKEKFIHTIYKELGMYLKVIKYRVRELLREFTLNGLDFDDIKLEEKYYRYLWYCGFFDCYRFINDLLSKNLINRIKSSSYVVVYGAGMIGSEVINQLLSYGIHNIKVAVSKKQNENEYLMGYKVEEIDDLKNFKSDCIVLIAAAKKHHGDMISCLRNNGFYNYVVMI